MTGRERQQGDLADVIREDVRRIEREWKEAADPGCRVCLGHGKTHGYVAPSKTATYACPCTGWRPS